MRKDNAKKEDVTQSRYYGWKDRDWSKFIMSVLKKLEPRQYQPDEMIYRDMEEVEVIIFVQSGFVRYSSNNLPV